MIRCFKTEIEPTLEQKNKINKTIGTCRFIYNFFIAHNIKRYENGEKYMNDYAFSLWINNDFIPDNPEYKWIKEVSTKAVRKSMANAHIAFKSFFEHKTGYPNFKKKNRSDVKMYFCKNSKNDCYCERHRIIIPTIGSVRLKEKGYLPTTKDGYVIKSGFVSVIAGRYFISVNVELPDHFYECNGEGIGIDLGIKTFATLSNGIVYENINKMPKTLKVLSRIKKTQRELERKGKGSHNRKKQLLKLQKNYQKLCNIRTDYVNKVIAEIVKTKPSFVAIENLHVSGMIRNRHLSDSIASLKFYEFRSKLENKGKELGIEIRIVNRWYPSSKLCHNCGKVTRKLSLADRTFICNCGYVNDRDINASLNIRDATEYSIA